MLQVMEPKFILRNLQQNNQSLFKKAAGMFRGFLSRFFCLTPCGFCSTFLQIMEKTELLKINVAL